MRRERWRLCGVSRFSNAAEPRRQVLGPALAGSHLQLGVQTQFRATSHIRASWNSSASSFVPDSMIGFAKTWPLRTKPAAR